MLIIPIAIFFHIITNKITNNRILKDKKRYNIPLNDIIHNNTYDLSHYKYLPDILAFLF